MADVFGWRMSYAGSSLKTPGSCAQTIRKSNTLPMLPCLQWREESRIGSRRQRCCLLQLLFTFLFLIVRANRNNGPIVSARTDMLMAWSALAIGTPSDHQRLGIPFAPSYMHIVPDSTRLYEGSPRGLQSRLIRGLTLVPCIRMDSVTTIRVKWIRSRARSSGSPCCIAYIR